MIFCVIKLNSRYLIDKMYVRLSFKIEKDDVRVFVTIVFLVMQEIS
jgi:hypothetical protein